jgi:hypothetical protein
MAYTGQDSDEMRQGYMKQRKDEWRKGTLLVCVVFLYILRTNVSILVLFHGATAPGVGRDSSVEASRLQTTFGRTPLDEWSARRRDHYITHNVHNRQTSMHLAGFEAAIPESELQQTHALDHKATGMGSKFDNSEGHLWLFRTQAQQPDEWYTRKAD